MNILVIQNISGAVIIIETITITIPAVVWAVLTCFVSIGHGVQPDVVKLGAGILIQQAAKLTKKKE